MTTDPDSLTRAAGWLRSAREVVVFTGAGVSAESGIPTFRDTGGFWQRFPVEQFATWQGLEQVLTWQPQRLAEFLYAVLHPLAGARPNAGHRAIAELEQHVRVTVITQNVDRLHQEAGSTRVHEVHGSLFQVVDPDGQIRHVLSRRAMQDLAEELDRARHRRPVGPRVWLAIRPLVGPTAAGLYRPRIVLFGEAMAEPDWSDALEAACRCDCMLQVGTSRTVMPAAMLPLEAKAAGARLITIDPDECPGDVWLQGTAATVLPQVVRLAFGEGAS